ncbi:MAG TPA: SirB2 family protein [Burkholderiales bacterium]|nr:SirB2 family protein [Burkholderiales bacterium]
MYLFLKYLHIVCVAASFGLFFIRGVWAIRSYPQPQEAWVRGLPHAIDAVLVVSALAMLYMSFGAAWSGNWMAAKLGYIAVYVVIAVYALRFAQARAAKVLAWLAALLLFLHITAVAVLHSPSGLLGLL